MTAQIVPLLENLTARQVQSDMSSKEAPYPFILAM